MPDERLQLIVRRMLLEDIDQVLELDRLSFPLAWSAHTYRHEILNNDRSTMLVIEMPGVTAPSNGNRGGGWLQTLFPSPSPPEAQNSMLIGYSGFWHIADEAHISTIAVHPDWRGRHLGELLIWLMVREGIRLGAAMVTLEVRVSNTVAQNLYRKYGFETTGRRKGYYRDNHEDAYMMTVTPLDDAYEQQLAAFGKEMARTLRVTTRGLTLTT